MDEVLSGLAGLLRQSSARRRPPVERWHPEHCGDIGLAISSDGTWYYRGSPIGREALVRLFASVLRREPDGRHVLVTPVEMVEVAVEDAPFLAVELEASGRGREQRLLMRTNVDDVVEVGPAHPLRFAVTAPDGGLKPYVLVRGGLEARATRPVYLELVELAVNELRDRRDVLGVWGGGAFFALE